VRVLRAIVLVFVGVVGGFAAAAALAKRALPSRGDAESDELALVAILDGIALKSRARAFRGGSMLAWLGGIAVDLREAELAPEAHLTVTSLLGGIALKVPPGWRVESTARAISGGVAVDVPEPESEAAPRLVVEGVAVLGGIAIKAGERTETQD
jgi:hypothetical protein